MRNNTVQFLLSLKRFCHQDSKGQRGQKFLICMVSLCISGLFTFSFVKKANAQETIALKIQMRNFKNEVVKDNINLKADDKNPVNKYGENIYEFKIPAIKNDIKLEIIGDEFKIFYPLNNKLLIPKDATNVIEIIVGTDKDFGTLVSIYPLIKKLQAEKANSADYCKTAAKLMEEIKNLKEDSIIMQIKRDSVFNQLSPILNRYVNAAFDLKKFLHRFDSIYFNNPKATAMLDSQIVNYSDAWQAFYFRKDEFSKVIATYWYGDAAIQSMLNNVLRDIERIHKIYYYAQFNDLSDEFINVPATATSEKEKKSKYALAVQKFKMFSDNSALNEELNMLEKNINELKFQLK